MPTPLNDESLDRIFRTARTYYGFRDTPITDSDIHAVWDLMKWGPTSANQEPARLVWCVSQEAKDKLAEAFRNGTLQGAYFIVAARALGFDTGPMSGFDNAKVDAEFLGGTTFRSNFISTIGVGDPATIHERLPRLSFEDVNRIA